MPQGNGVWGLLPLRLDHGGPYTVRVLGAPGPVTVSVLQNEYASANLAVDGPAGSLSTQALQGGEFRFSGVRGQRVWLRGTVPFFSAVELRAPSGGAQVFHAGFGPFEAGPIFLAEAGTYAVRVGDQGGPSTMQVSSHAGRCTPSCDDGDPCTDDRCDVALGCAHAPNTACGSCALDADCASSSRCVGGLCRAVDLTVGETVARSLDFGVETGATFYAAAGERLGVRVAIDAFYTLTLVGPYGGIYAQATVFTPGTVVSLGPLAQSAVYRITLRTTAGAAYPLAAAVTLVPLGPAVVSATATPGGAAAAVTSDVGQQSVVRFTGTAGSRVAVDLDTSTAFGTTVTWLAPSGASLGSFAGTRLGPVVLPESGTYTLAVGELPGVHTLRVVELAPTVTLPLEVGGPAVSSTQAAAFVVEGEAGQRFGLMNASAAGRSQLNVLSPSGSLLFSGGVSPGPFGALAFSETGSFQLYSDGGADVALRAEVIPADRTALAVPNAGPVSLTATSDFHALVFHVPVSAGASLSARLRASASTSASVNGTFQSFPANIDRPLGTVVPTVSGERAYAVTGVRPGVTYTLTVTAP